MKAHILDNLLSGRKLRKESGSIVSDIGDITAIRNQIINTVYLFCGIIGVFPLGGSLIRVIFTGWQPSIILYVCIFFYVWIVFIFRHKISLHFKAAVFVILFFIAGCILNFSNGIISGAVQFIFVTVIVTLIYGWKLGIFSVIITLIVRAVIAVLYFNGILKYNVDLNAFAFSIQNTIVILLGAFIVGAVTVFAINKLYSWLILSIQQLSVKADELARSNIELEAAKKKAEEHDRLKTVFLANMSHEIRTPMNAIIGFSTFLAKPDLSPVKREKFSNLVQERSYDLLRIIEDILDISKIEIGQMSLIEHNVSLYELLNEIYKYYKLKLAKTEQKTDIKLVLSISEELKNFKICIDGSRVKQIMNNLIENAIKFTNSGFIEIGCSLVDKTKLELYVKDSGIGISKENQSVIFDRFRQADDSLSSRKFGGTGLGLSIVKGLVELMNGKIDLESEIDKGSTFKIILPFVRAKEIDQNELNQKLENQQDLKIKSVLIIEDDDANTQYLKELFSDTGVEVLHSYTGTEALKIIEQKKNIDLILMDIRLPDINGLDLTRNIKKNNPQQIIIAQTAYAGSEDLNYCIDAGCNDYIAKPINPDTLKNLLSQYFA